MVGHIITEEFIKEINKEAPYDQGIFKEGYGIPIHIKEPCIYSRWETGGYTGGNCWGDEAHRYDNDIPKDKHEILDLILSKLRPDITALQLKNAHKLWDENTDTTYEYYGNSRDWTVNFIKVSDLEAFLNTI